MNFRISYPASCFKFICLEWPFFKSVSFSKTEEEKTENRNKGNGEKEREEKGKKKGIGEKENRDKGKKGKEEKHYEILVQYKALKNPYNKQTEIRVFLLIFLIMYFTIFVVLYFMLS